MALATRRKSSAKRSTGNDNEEGEHSHIRYDYSATHLDNEELAIQFEDQVDDISRDKYRMMVETDKLLKKAKQSADDMLLLKNKVKIRQPNESSEKVRNSLRPKRHSVGAILSHNQAANKQSNGENKHTTETHNHLVDGKHETGEVVDDDEVKPSNNLTMFLLSIQRVKRPQAQQTFHERNDERLDKRKPTDAEIKRKLQQRPMTSAHMTSRPGGYLNGDRTNPEEEDSMEGARQQYGIHVRKDFSRSRRELEEVSKLERGGNNRCVNKYEERRQQLLARSKDTQSLQHRINYFLKNVDEFKCSDDSSRVLPRSKTTLHSNRSPYVC